MLWASWSSGDATVRESSGVMAEGGAQEAGDALGEVEAGPTFPLDVSGPGGERLRSTVKTKLSEFMGSYSDDVLAEYVVVLVGHGKHQKQATADLEAFLGHQSEAFVSWLWDHLTNNLGDYAQEPVTVPSEATATNSAERPEEAQAAGSRETTQKDQPSDSVKLSKEAPEKERRDAREEKSEPRQDLKRSRSPEPWSRRRRTRAENIEPKDPPGESDASAAPEKARPPRLKASRLLQFAVRDAVTRKAVDSSSKKLRSVVSQFQENGEADTNGGGTGLAKQGSKVAPAMIIALKAAAAAAEDVTTWKPRVATRVTQSPKRRDFRPHSPPEQPENGTRPSRHQSAVSREPAGRARSRRPREEEPLDEEDEPHIAQERRIAQLKTQKAQKARQTPAAAVKPLEGHADGGEPQGVMEMRKKMRQVQLEMARLRTSSKEAQKAVAATAASAAITHSAPAHSVAAAPVATPTTSFKPLTAPPSLEDPDSRIVLVTNVHFATTKEALSAHFSSCGDIVKVTLLTDGVSGKPKGSAYVEFSSRDAADRAVSLSESCLLSRPLRVVRKDATSSAETPITAVAPAAAATMRPPPPATIVRPVRMPVRAFPRAAFMRGSPYMLRPPPRLVRPPFPAAPHLQWKRDATGGSSNGNPAAAAVKNGFRSNVGPMRLKRSLSYVRPAVPPVVHPPEAMATSTEEQKGS